MAIGTSDGMVYDDELQYHMGEPSLKITVNKAEPIAETPKLDPAYGPYDDGPTYDQQTRDILSGTRTYDNLKGTEQEFEDNQQQNGGIDEDYSKTLPLARKIGDTVPVQDPFNTKIKGKDQDRVPPNTSFPNPAAPERVTATKTGYDTPLGEDTAGYEAWTDKNGFSLPESERDYDLKGYYKANPNFEMKEGKHMADTFKKPNHITFSKESKYNGVDGNEGGQWEKLDDGSWSFTPGKTNYEHYTPQEMREYFQKYEKGNTLILPGSQLQIDRTDGETNLLSLDKEKIASEDGAPEGGARRAHHRFLEALRDHSFEGEATDAFRREIRRSPADGTFRPAQQMFDDWTRFNQREHGEFDGDATNAYRRELRRSPADGTFRNQGSMHTDWEGFNRVLIRPPVDPLAQIPFEHDPDPRAPHETDEPTWRQRLTRGREHGSVAFETTSGKQGALTYIYDPGKKDIYIQWMGSASGDFYGRNAIEPHELGIDKTLKILKAVVEQYPEAKTVTAMRAGGARVTHGGGGRSVTREIPRERLEATAPSGGAAPLTVGKLPGLPEPGIGGAPGQRLTDFY